MTHIGIWIRTKGRKLELQLLSQLGPRDLIELQLALDKVRMQAQMLPLPLMVVRQPGLRRMLQMDLDLPLMVVKL
jgi:hypothetical protein|uniref:Uncharacterized protein n=1 Tax=Picea glauca TaxID=3330 RepID=A0A117NI04_PICGL|nr:hypothetical protein ABT39_MTgene3767 [Picea glauca]QHR86048.1 hypothetical protein Q903MT_gene46 [Picea sitchensis]